MNHDARGFAFTEHGAASKNLLTAEFSDDALLEVMPALVVRSIDRSSGIISESLDTNLKHLEDDRFSEMITPKAESVSGAKFDATRRDQVLTQYQDGVEYAGNEIETPARK